MSLLQRIDQIRRAAVTGFAFALFGLGGVVIALTVFPVVNLMPGSQEKKRRRGQRLVHLCFRLFIWLWKCLGLLSYDKPDLEALNRPGQLIIANHPSLIDVVFLISFIKETNCVVKQGVYRNPFLRGIASAAQYISNENSDGLLDDCAASLNRGNTLLIFPEGTRTRLNTPMKMQRGAANIALRANLPLQPVAIHCTESLLNKELAWYQAPPRKPHFRFEVLPPIPLPQDASQPSSKRARQLTQSIDRCLTSACAVGGQN